MLKNGLANRVRSIGVRWLGVSVALILSLILNIVALHRIGALEDAQPGELEMMDADALALALQDDLSAQEKRIETLEARVPGPFAYDAETDSRAQGAKIERNESDITQIASRLDTVCQELGSDRCGH